MNSLKFLLLVGIMGSVCNGQDYQTQVTLYIRDLLLDFNKLDPGIHDVSILNLVSNPNAHLANDFVDQLVEMIPKENPVTIPDLRNVVTDIEYARSYDFNIILSDQHNYSIIQRLNSTFYSPFWDVSSKCIYIPINSDLHNFTALADLFYHVGILNFAAVKNNSELGGLRIHTWNPFFKKEAVTSPKTGKLPAIFPDKLSNLNGYHYRVLAFCLAPRLLCEGDEFLGIEKFLLDTLVGSQNANFTINRVEVWSPDFSYEETLKVINGNDYDLILNVVYPRTDNNTVPILSYDIYGACAVIPIHHKKLRVHYSVNHPFSLEIWMSIFALVVVTMIVWKYLHCRHHSGSSTGFFLMAIFGNFMGQGVGLRIGSSYQKYLWILMMLCSFWLSNFFSSELLSLDVDTNEFREINKFEDLFHSNQKIIIGHRVYDAIKYVNFSPEISNKFVKMYEHEFRQQIGKGENCFIARCDVVRAFLGYDGGQTNYFYALDETMFINYLYYYYNKFNPFKGKLQDFYSFVFEASLKTYFKLIERPVDKKKRERSVEANLFFGMTEMAAIFLDFLIGMAISTVVLIGEICIFKIQKILLKWKAKKQTKMAAVTKKSPHILELDDISLEEYEIRVINEV